MKNLCTLFSTEPPLPDATLFLNFQGNALGDKTGKELQHLFSLIKPGVSIDLNNNYLWLKSGAELREMFAALQPGVSIGLKYNGLGYHKSGEELRAMFAALQPGVSIVLRHNGLGQKSGEELRAMFAALQPGVSIDLRDDGLGKKSGEELRALFAALQPGVSIGLSDNGLWIKSGEELRAMFAALQPGVGVDLSNNILFWTKSGEEMVAMFAALKPGVSIDLSKNQLHQTNGTDLRAMFTALQPGVRIDLSNNALCWQKNSEDLSAIYAALQPGVSVCLRNNYLGKRDGEELRAMFAALKPGVSIDLRSNNLGLKSGEELHKMFAALQPGVRINLSKNNLEKKDAAELKNLFASFSSGVSVNLGLSHFLAEPELTEIAAQIPHGVILSLSVEDLKNSETLLSLFAAASNITAIELDDLELKNTPLSQLTSFIMSLPDSIQTVRINRHLLERFSPETQLHLKLLLEAKCSEVYFYSKSNEAESVLPMLRQVFQETVAPANDLGAIVLGYLTPGSSSEWTKKMHKDELNSNKTLVSLLEAWVEQPHPDKKEAQFIHPLSLLLEAAKGQIDQSEHAPEAHYALFLALEWLKGTISIQEIKECAKGLNEALAQPLLIGPLWQEALKLPHDLVHYYSFVSEQNEGRYHFFSAQQATHPHLQGDALKSKILLDFKQALESATTPEELQETIATLRESDEYQTLEAGQGIITRLFELQTSSVSAFEKMCTELEHMHQQKEEDRSRIINHSPS